MRIAICDYKVLSTNPIGSCHLRIIQNMSGEHDFAVFAAEFENPLPGHIRFIRIPTPVRPLALLYLAFHLVSAIRFWTYRLAHRDFDLIQAVESNFMFANIYYCQFCHKAFLRDHWKDVAGPRGLRRFARWLDHALHALFEARIYRKARHVVVPSRGLMRELHEQYPFTRGKVHLIYNPVDLAHLQPDPRFLREEFRKRRNLENDDVVAIFIALGHFERKGLPIVLRALTQTHSGSIKLLVVGGERDLVAKYQAWTTKLGLERRVILCGMQKDVRPFLWAADCFVFPSAYETFGLAVFEAAAAGLPVISTSVYGVEEFLNDGVNGFVVERSPSSVASALDRFRSLPPPGRLRMGRQARQAVDPFSSERFAGAWREFYRQRALELERGDHGGDN